MRSHRKHLHGLESQAFDLDFLMDEIEEIFDEEKVKKLRDEQRQVRKRIREENMAEKTRIREEKRDWKRNQVLKVASE